MYQLILMLHVMAAASIVGLVLLQQGKGASMGAAFGAGASQTVFGSRGSGSFLLKITICCVAVFFGTSIALNNMTARAVKSANEMHLPAGLPMAPAAPVEKQVNTENVTPSSIPVTE